MGPRPVGAQPGMVGMYPQGALGQHAGAGYPQQQPRMAQQQQQPNDPFVSTQFYAPHCEFKNLKY